MEITLGHTYRWHAYEKYINWDKSDSSEILSKMQVTIRFKSEMFLLCKWE